MSSTSKALTTTYYKVHPVIVEVAHGGAAPAAPGRLEVEFADAQVAPVSTSALTGANSELETYPSRAHRP